MISVRMISLRHRTYTSTRTRKIKTKFALTATYIQAGHPTAGTEFFFDWNDAPGHS